VRVVHDCGSLGCARSFTGWGGRGEVTYIGESLGFVLGFNVGPQTNRLVGGKGPVNKLQSHNYFGGSRKCL
jgi:hypothetical protein